MALHFDYALRLRSNSVKTPGLYGYAGVVVHRSASLASMYSFEEGEVTKRLAAWAGIFGVATAFVGVWGMNFDIMPELRMRYGYPAALSLIAVICGLLYRRFKKVGWL
ncbi:MAG: hypothetical protein FJ190_10965 [Gammaproteobacteria bacterium]|nr:hypothetical protein [Gammaproteobacteria bacterium]